MSNLSDFGGGREDIREELSEPEHRVQLDLSRWFAANGADVYWDENPTDEDGEGLLSRTEFSTFEKSGIIPDLLVVGADGTSAIEVKNANNTGNIHTGVHETYEYWHDYTLNDGVYRVDGTRQEIDTFLLASQYSIEGALYARWFDDTARELPIDERWGIDRPIHVTPDREFTATEEATRHMWRRAKEVFDPSAPFSSQEPVDEHPGIGAVLSTILDGASPSRPSSDYDETPPQEWINVFDPKAFYKRPVAKGDGFRCHNWRWL